MGPAISRASCRPTLGSSAMMIVVGMTTYTAVKNIIRMPILRSVSLRALRALPRSSAATAREIFGKIAVEMDTAMSEYGRIYSVKAF